MSDCDFNNKHATCTRCGLRAMDLVAGKLPIERARLLRRPCPLASTDYRTCGVGVQLHRLLHLMGFRFKPTCRCAAYAAQMNKWGPAGCRERKTEIIEWLVERATEESYATLAKAALKAAARGMRINPFHPIDSLVDLATELAEATASHRRDEL